MGEILDITDELTASGIEKLEIGQVLIFQQGGDRYELRVVSKDERVLAEQITTYDPDDIKMDVVDSNPEAFEEEDEEEPKKEA